MIGGAAKTESQDKLIVFSDALDVETIETTYHHFHGKVRMSFGWGTNLTNDFEGCAPRYDDQINAISLVCRSKTRMDVPR